MKSVHKVLISLLASVVIFTVFTILGFSGLFEQIETDFYYERVKETSYNSLTVIGEHLRSKIGSTVNSLRELFADEAFQRSYRVNQSQSDILRRQELFTELSTGSSGLTAIRIIDADGEALHYSTRISDIRSQDRSQINYRSLENIESSIPFTDLIMIENEAAVVFFSSEENQFIYAQPLVDDFNLYQGTALAYISPVALELELIKQGQITSSEKITLINENILLVNTPGSVFTTFQKEFSDSTELLTDNQEFPFFIGDSGYLLFPSVLEDDLFLNNIKLLFIVPLSSVELSPEFRIIILTAIFLTSFLILFLLLNIRQDKMILVSDRLKRFQIYLVQEYFDKKEDIDVKNWTNELRHRKNEVRKQITSGIKNLDEKQEAEINNLIDKNWDDLVQALGTNQLPNNASNLDVKKLEKTLERIISNLSIDSSKILPPSQKLAVPKKESKPISSLDTSGMTPVEVEEISEAEELEELDAEVAEVEPEPEAGPVAEVEAVEELEEIAEAEPVEDAEALDTSGMTPVEVEEINEVEELEELETEVAEVESEPEAGPVAEVEAVEELEEIAEAEPVEDAEALDTSGMTPVEVEEINEVEELEELETEVAEAEPIAETEAVEELEDIAEAEPVEEAEALDTSGMTPVEVEEISEAEEVDELEAAPVAELEVAEVEELEDIAEAEPVEELEEIAETEAVEELEEIAEAEPVLEAAPVEELSELEELESAPQEQASQGSLGSIEEEAEIEIGFVDVMDTKGEDSTGIQNILEDNDLPVDSHFPIEEEVDLVRIEKPKRESSSRAIHLQGRSTAQISPEIEDESQEATAVLPSNSHFSLYNYDLGQISNYGGELAEAMEDEWENLEIYPFAEIFHSIASNKETITEVDGIAQIDESTYQSASKKKGSDSKLEQLIEDVTGTKETESTTSIDELIGGEILDLDLQYQDEAMQQIEGITIEEGDLKLPIVDQGVDFLTFKKQFRKGFRGQIKALMVLSRMLKSRFAVLMKREKGSVYLDLNIGFDGDIDHNAHIKCGNKLKEKHLKNPYSILMNVQAGYDDFFNTIPPGMKSYGTLIVLPLVNDSHSHVLLGYEQKITSIRDLIDPFIKGASESHKAPIFSGS